LECFEEGSELSSSFKKKIFVG